MKKKKAILSFTYSTGQITTGLLLHPYQTMQSLVREKIFIWMTLLPSIFLALITFVWRSAFVPTVQLFFSCNTTSFIGCDLLVLASNFITFFSIYWQILLFYLLLRFHLAFRKKQ